MGCVYRSLCNTAIVEKGKIARLLFQLRYFKLHMRRICAYIWPIILRKSTLITFEQLVFH